MTFSDSEIIIIVGTATFFGVAGIFGAAFGLIHIWRKYQDWKHDQVINNIKRSKK